MVSRFFKNTSNELPVMAPFSRATIDRLQTCAQAVNLTAGDKMSLGAIGLIISGSAKLVRTLPNGADHISEFAYPGSLLFGHTGESEAPHLTALESARILLLPNEPCLTTWAEDGTFWNEIMKAAMARIQSLEIHAARLARMSACERVAAFLISLVKIEAYETNSLRLHLPMSRADIGNHLGLTIETISRCIARLKNEKLVACPSRHEMLILDVRRLAIFHKHA